MRHITFKRLKVGRRVCCSVLYTVFVGEKRREEKRRGRGRGREEKRIGEKRQRRKEREESKKKGTREEEKERRESPPRAHVQQQDTHVFNSCGRFAGAHGGVLKLHTEACWTRARREGCPRTKPCHIPHNTTTQHHNTQHNMYTQRHMYIHTRSQHQVYTHAHNTHARHTQHNTIDNRP